MRYWLFENQPADISDLKLNYYWFYFCAFVVQIIIKYMTLLILLSLPFCDRQFVNTEGIQL